MLFKTPRAPPSTENELMERVRLLSGHTLGEIAKTLNWDVPEDTTRHKGWAGSLLEEWLGTTAGTRPVPDFEALGIELKTLPVGRNGRPLESTYITMVSLTNGDDQTWDTSAVLHKLQCVLWIPILAERDIAIADRMVGRGVLWRPLADDLAVLRKDWESHLRAIREGFVEATRGSDGEYLQIRPKAANAQALTWAVDEFGDSMMTMPRGFYLRTLFTEMVLRRSLEVTRVALNDKNSEGNTAVEGEKTEG